MITNKLSKDGLLILLFHGVIGQSNQVRNYIRKHIEQDYFLEILEKLKVSGTCLSMDEVIEYHESGKIILLTPLRSLLMMALKIMLPLRHPYLKALVCQQLFISRLNLLRVVQCHGQIKASVL